MRYRERGPRVRPFLLLLIPLLLLAGCRTAAEAPPAAVPAAVPAAAPAQATPEQQLAAALEAPPPPGLARIVFYRQAIPFLQALSPDVIVNGKRVGTAGAGSAFIRQARPGGYEVFSTHDPERVVRFTLAAGDTRYVKTGPEFQGLGFRLSATEVPARRARAELGDLELRRDRMAGRPDRSTQGGAGRR